MKVAGLDLSMNSSGIVKLELDDNCNIVKAERMGFTSVKKNEGLNIFFYKKTEFITRYDLTLWMNDKIQSFISDCDYIAVEDYAFGANGVVFDIGEFVGFVKISAFQKNIPLRLYDPNSIKKFATGSGNADKITMYDAFVKLNTIKPDISTLPIPTKGSGASPTSDVIDAHYIASLLATEIKLRKGIVALRSLSEANISIFNRVTKAHPVCILDTEFLKKM